MRNEPSTFKSFTRFLLRELYIKEFPRKHDRSKGLFRKRHDQCAQEQIICKKKLQAEKSSVSPACASIPSTISSKFCRLVCGTLANRLGQCRCHDHGLLRTRTVFFNLREAATDNPQRPLAKAFIGVCFAHLQTIVGLRLELSPHTVKYSQQPFLA